MLPLKTIEESMGLINARAQHPGADGKFLVKIFRKKPGIGTFLHQATFADCFLAHITSFESWVPRIFGGGQLFARVFHSDEATSPLGDHMEMNFDSPPYPQPDFGAIARAGSQWPGPVTVAFPDLHGAPGLQLNAPPSQVGSPGTGGSGASLTQGYGAPPQGNQAAPGINASEASLIQREREFLAKEAALTRQMNEREERMAREIAEAKASLERDRLEARLKADAEAQARRHQAEMEELKKLVIGNSTQQAPKPAFDVQALITALAPIFIQMQQANAARADAMAAQQREFMQILVAQNQKATGMTPEMQMLIETLKSQSGGSSEMMSRIVDAMSTVSKTSVGMIEAIADLNLGGAPEHPMLMAIKEGVKAMAQLSKGAESGARRALTPRNAPPPQLPSQVPQQLTPQQIAAIRQQQQQQQQQAQLRAQAEFAAGQRHAQQQAAVQQQAQVVPFPKPANGASAPIEPAPEVIVQAPNTPTPNVPPAFDGVEPPPAAKKFDPANNAVDQLEQLIRNKHEPRDEVVTFFFASLDTPEMKAELAKHGGDVDELVSARLQDWMGEVDNMVYLKELGDMIEEVGEEKGMWEPEEEEAGVEEVAAAD